MSAWNSSPHREQLFLAVVEAYDRWSPFYDTYDNPMVFMAAEIVNRSLAGAAGAAVFEFGCGTGRNLAALTSFGATEISGCDLSEGMLKVARARIPRADLFRHDMSQAVPVPDRTFDLTLFCLTLEHVSDIGPPLREAVRITKASGRISIIEIHPYLSLEGVAAHFDEEGVDVRMPTYPHQFEHYLNAFAELRVAVASCREWRPSDIGNPLPLRKLGRGPDVPLALEFSLEPALITNRD
jgi:malonyl-CoA O-methyltransferase